MNIISTPMKTVLITTTMLVIFAFAFVITYIIDSIRIENEGYTVGKYMREVYIPEHEKELTGILTAHLADSHDVSGMQERDLQEWMRGNAEWIFRSPYWLLEQGDRELAIVTVDVRAHGVLKDSNLVFVKERLCILLPLKRSRPKKLMLLWDGSDRTRVDFVDLSGDLALHSQIVEDNCSESIIWSGIELKR